MYALIDPGRQVRRWEALKTDDDLAVECLRESLESLLAGKEPSTVGTVIEMGGLDSIMLFLPATADLILWRDTVAREWHLTDIDRLCVPDCEPG